MNNLSLAPEQQLELDVYRFQQLYLHTELYNRLDPADEHNKIMKVKADAVLKAIEEWNNAWLEKCVASADESPFANMFRLNEVASRYFPNVTRREPTAAIELKRKK